MPKLDLSLSKAIYTKLMDTATAALMSQYDFLDTAETYGIDIEEDASVDARLEAVNKIAPKLARSALELGTIYSKAEQDYRLEMEKTTSALALPAKPAKSNVIRDEPTAKLAVYEPPEAEAEEDLEDESDADAYISIPDAAPAKKKAPKKAAAKKKTATKKKAAK